jgi:rhodanese-related sulfurtransferase
MSEPTLEVTPQEVRRRIDAGEAVVLLDVREPSEYALARIEGSKLIPMNTVPAQLPAIEELADGATLVAVCHHGVRSLNVAAWLHAQGIGNCVSMTGGIDRWSLEINPAVPRY